MLVLDRDLRIVEVTPSAERLLGSAPRGSSAPKVLCGDGPDRPIAEALIERRAVHATISPVSASGLPLAVDVRASPIEGGFLLELSSLLRSEPDREVNLFGFVTQDAKTIGLLDLVRRVAASEVTVLVRGETGTGKELIARAIHRLSPRKNGPFQALNCAALSPMLLESELFGHVRGAFTGAHRDHLGHFRLADRGTLFLDEVGELPLELQAKLLRALETRMVMPVGSTELIPVDVRIVSATHRSLRASVESGSFREDLMYRLRVVPLFLPPLRERVGDVRLLVGQMIARRNETFARKIHRISEDAWSAIESYAWPGNVRELENAVDYAFVVGDGPVLAAADLPPEIVETPSSPSHDDRAAIEAAIEKAHGHLGQAAKLLGVSRVTLWRRMKALNAK
ncbi:MAG: sigma 54-interacting transcriptional regulator [Deltaproteobacteria bacterium]|nr:sigma 54-interacting transcriptional regulator [Deltaproteobacteria bacterium]